MPDDLAGISLAEAAGLIGATLRGDPTRTILSVAPLGQAGTNDLSLFNGQEDPALLEETRAAAVLVPVSFERSLPDPALLETTAPHQAFLTVARELWDRQQRRPPGISSSASVHSGAHIAAGAHVGGGCEIGCGASVGRRAVLHAHVTVAEGAVIGAETVLHPGVYVGPGVRIGDRAIVHPGAVLGFSQRPAAPGQPGSGKTPSTGVVVIEDGVEIGPNSVVERGETGETRICSGARLGALVVVGHDCVVGPGAELVAMVGLAGGVRVGEDALLFGQVGVSSGARIGPRAVVLAKSGVAGRVPAGAQYAGIIARPRRDWLKAQAALRRLPAQLERLRELERRLEARLGAVGVASED